MAQQPPPQPLLSPGHSPSYPQGTLSYPAKWQRWLGVWQEGSVCCHRAPQPREPSLPTPLPWDQDSPLLEQGYVGPLTPSPPQPPSCHAELGSLRPQILSGFSLPPILQATSRAITHLVSIIHLFSGFGGSQEAPGTRE